MKHRIKFISLLCLWSLTTFAQNSKETAFFEGSKLFSTVERYVSLGEHRTGTDTDFATSEWLGKELSTQGYEVKYHTFGLKQFFLDKAFVTDPTDSTVYEAFPLWYVQDSIRLQAEGILTSNVSNPDTILDKIVLVNFTLGLNGRGATQVYQQLQDLISKGARAIIGFTENEANEIIALNASKAGSPWKIPILLVSPKHAKQLLKKEGKIIKVAIHGEFAQVNARNVYGKIGNNESFIVVSTPISGWFTCGGERGPGVAVWLALAQWASTQKLPYTFIFTANSGHELGFWGADEFLEHHAPPTDKTKLWIHLGAGLATLSWKSTPSGLIKENKVDPQRNFFYTTSTKTAFERVFKNILGNKWDTQQKNGGELIHVVNKGYPNAIGVSYAHPFFHTKNDDASKTSPEILEEIALAFKNLILEIAK
ncbi:MAG: M28 family peptidase [Microscillaceae bacterium]|nr:M28 family peptidase [Microscillaceae bacterium]